MDGSGVFTFDSTLPTPRDRVRHLVGDVDPTNPLRFNETYDAMLDYYDGDEAAVTAKIARALASELARQPSSVSIPGGPSVSYADRVKALQDIATKFESVTVSSSGGTATSMVASRPGMNDVDTTGEYRRDWTAFLDSLNL